MIKGTMHISILMGALLLGFGWGITARPQVTCGVIEDRREQKAERPIRPTFTINEIMKGLQ